MNVETFQVKEYKKAGPLLAVAAFSLHLSAPAAVRLASR